MNKNGILILELVCILAIATACEQPPAPPESIPTSVPTLVAIAEPTFAPQATPVPAGPDFQAIRRNREAMNPDQIAKYGANMAGKKIEGWIGYVETCLETEGEPGKSRLVIDMDRDTGGLPDVILEGIPTDIAKGFQSRQELNFSGTIQGYVDTPDVLFLLSMSDVKIYGSL